MRSDRCGLASALACVLLVLGACSGDASAGVTTSTVVETTVSSDTTSVTLTSTTSEAGSTTTTVVETIGSWDPIPDAPWGYPDTFRAWTGAELIVFPEYTYGLEAPESGVGHTPTTREWRALAPPPELRGQPAVVWTGGRLLVWGGTVESDVDGYVLSNTGFSYDPTTDAWTDIPAAPLDPQTSPFHVWTGQELIVWGGSTVVDDIFLGGTTIGAAYDPQTGEWRLLNESPLDSRNPGVGIWTGTEMIIGGNGDQTDGDATWAAYNRDTDTWRRLPDPPSRAGGAYQGVWTGAELIIALDEVDGGLPESRIYALDPTTDTWREAAPPGQSLSQTAAVWTGEYILYWGDTGSPGVPFTSLGYDPTTDTWTPVAESPMRDRFAHQTATVIGPDMVLIWGGTDEHATALPDGAIVSLEPSGH